MLVFTNPYAQAASYIAAVCLACGFAAFVTQVSRWDREYENFLIFPLRLAIYVPYLLLPGVGAVVGAFMLKSPKEVNRKFGRASIYVSLIGLLLWSTLAGTAIR
jgi:hypothetical protein